MRAALGKRWVWLAVGSLGIGTAALAQNSPYMTTGTQSASAPSAYAPANTPAIAPAAQPRCAGAIAVPKLPADPHYREACGRLTEIKIELAWLADPVTFPCQLDAHFDRCLVEISGTVPNVTTHARAVALASENCERSIVDGLSVKNSGAPTVVHESVEHLNAAAQAILREQLPKLAHNLKVEASQDGRICVSGTLPSYEEKLLVSLKLRSISGCTCIDNRTQVWGSEDRGKSFCKVSVDGQLHVAAGPLTPPPPPPFELPAPEIKTAVAATTATARPAYLPPPESLEGHVAVRPPVFEKLRTHEAPPATSNPTRVVQASAQAPATAPAARPAPAKTVAAPTVAEKPSKKETSVARAPAKPVPSAKPVAAPTLVVEKSSASPYGDVSEKKEVSVAQVPVTPAPAQPVAAPTRLVENSSASPYGDLSEKKEASPTPVAARPTVPAKPAPPDVVKPSYAQTPATATATAKAPNKVPAYVAAAAHPLFGDSQPAKAPQVASSTPKTTNSDPKTSAKATDKDKTQTVKTADLRETPKQQAHPVLHAGFFSAKKAEPATPDAKAAERYRKRIQAECGRDAQRVEVSFPDAKTMKVVVAVREERVSGPLSEKIWHIRELSSYRVLIEAVVEKK
jgi:hypothetical protein